ncbi:MAG: tyrosine-type recombinase/integrase [Xenococcaceae cyanobacterium MO_188.B32]|nr:tyrosine-type recombinase/integrase [Xenococcaceae cyanobacterium MO_188.B32]
MYLYRYSQWQFLYGLLAVYGLRIHEAWNIANWDKSVTIEDSNGIIVTDNTSKTNGNDENGKPSYHQIKKKIVIPAILDPNNQDFWLCIGHETKTGFRVAFPISPHGHSSNCQWIKDFNLIQSLNLPDIKNPLERRMNGQHMCSQSVNKWFEAQKYGFTPHALRHAYNIRGHNLGINQKVLANSLGHGIIMNSTTYLRNESYESKLQGLKREIRQDNANRDKLEKLKLKLEKLENENKYLRSENEHLKTELKMYEALKGK